MNRSFIFTLIGVLIGVILGFIFRLMFGNWSFISIFLCAMIGLAFSKCEF